MYCSVRSSYSFNEIQYLSCVNPAILYNPVLFILKTLSSELHTVFIPTHSFNKNWKAFGHNVDKVGKQDER